MNIYECFFVKCKSAFVRFAGVGFFALLVCAGVGSFSGQFIGGDFVAIFSHVPSLMVLISFCIWCKRVGFELEVSGWFKPIKLRVYKVFGVLLVYIMAWISFSITLPQLGNALIGDTIMVQDTVTKRKSGRRTECRYQLDISSIDVSKLNYCITESEFNGLINESFKATTTVRKSFLGMYVANSKSL